MELWHWPNEFRHRFWPNSSSSLWHRRNNGDDIHIPHTETFSHPFGLTRLQSDLIGILLTILGAIFASLGSIWEAYEETRHGPLTQMSQGAGGYIQINTPLTVKESDRCNGLFQWKFILGILIWLFGAGLHILGLLFAAASLLGPVNSAGLVATLWLSCALLDDELTWETWMSTAGIVVGIGICLKASVHTGNPDQSDLATIQAQLLTSWTDPVYLGFCFSIMAFVLLGAYCIHSLNKRRSELEWQAFMLRPQYDLSKRPILSHRFQKTAAARELEDIKRRIQKQSDIAGMLLAVIGGTCGSQTVCQIKEVEAYWAMTEFKGYSYLLSPMALWAFLVLVVCATVQYPLISSAYALADHATVSALYHVSWTLLSVIGGFAKFKEHRRSTGWEITLFSIGLSLTLISTFIAAKRTVEGIVNVMGHSMLHDEWFMSGFNIAPFWNRIWAIPQLLGRKESLVNEAGIQLDSADSGGAATAVEGNMETAAKLNEEIEMQRWNKYNEFIVNTYSPTRELPETTSPSRSRTFDHA